MTEPILDELFSRPAGEDGLDADVLLPREEEEGEGLTPEQAEANFKQSIETSLRAGDSLEDIADDIEIALGFRPDAAQLGALRARLLAEGEQK